MSDVAFPGTIANTGGAFGEEAQTPPLMDPVTLAYSGGGGSPGGSGGQFQYNDDGSFGGSSLLEFDESDDLCVTTPTVFRPCETDTEAIGTGASYASNDLNYSGNLLIAGPYDEGNATQIMGDAKQSANETGLLIASGGHTTSVVSTLQEGNTSTVFDDGSGNFSQQTEGASIQVGAAAHLYSGSGAPTISANAGDFYFRTDTPGVSMQNIYVCTGTTNWTALV